MRYGTAVMLVILSAPVWSLSLQDRLVLDMYNKSVNKNLEEARSLATLNCRKASSRITGLILNTSQNGDFSEILNMAGLLLAILKESNSVAYREARSYVLDGDFELLSDMFDFEEQGVDCTTNRTLKNVINSAYIL